MKKDNLKEEIETKRKETLNKSVSLLKHPGFCISLILRL